MNERLVYGWGINDIKGSCGTPYYNKWEKMMYRVKSIKEHIRYPTYKECSICEEWKYLSNFKKWFDRNNYIFGYVLDKDLYVPNNKLYSPDTCLFISNDLNLMLTNSNGKGYRKVGNRYYPRLKIHGNMINLKGRDSAEIARMAHIYAKAEYWVNTADEYWKTNEKIAVGLYRHAETLLGNDWKETLPE